MIKRVRSSHKPAEVFVSTGLKRHASFKNAGVISPFFVVSYRSKKSVAPAGQASGRIPEFKPPFVFAGGVNSSPADKLITVKRRFHEGLKQLLLIGPVWP